MWHFWVSVISSNQHLLANRVWEFSSAMVCVMVSLRRKIFIIHATNFSCVFRNVLKAAGVPTNFSTRKQVCIMLPMHLRCISLLMCITDLVIGCLNRGRQKGWGKELYGEGGQYRSLAWVQVLWQAATSLSSGMSTNKLTSSKKDFKKHIFL